MSYKIKSFRGTYYNTQRLGGLEKLVCPPYDVIGKEKLKALRAKSAYNFTHILIASGDYKKIGEKFRGWLKDGILVDDTDESIYLYEQSFSLFGKRFCRFGILSLLKMESGILPHEHTLKKPKQDRKRVINEVKANLDPIFAVIPKRLGVLHTVYARYSKLTPFFVFKDCDGNMNRLWKISDSRIIERISAGVHASRLVIADGHHRFEVSYDYFKKNKGKFSDLDYILAYITDVQPGLVILPTHRIAETENIEDILKKLSCYFAIKKADEKSVLRGIESKSGCFSFGIYSNNNFYFLRLKDKGVLGSVSAPSPLYKELDTYLLHHFVFPKIKIKSEMQYSHSVAESKEMAGAGKTAFLLKSVPLKTIFKMADKGFRFPQKSTYFQPKVFSGIIIRRFLKGK